ncbi:hypothetical protein IWX48DRAFT_126513 [Phyllosticta citricarpa]
MCLDWKVGWRNRLRMQRARPPHPSLLFNAALFSSSSNPSSSPCPSNINPLLFRPGPLGRPVTNMDTLFCSQARNNMASNACVFQSNPIFLYDIYKTSFPIRHRLQHSTPPNRSAASILNRRWSRIEARCGSIHCSSRHCWSKIPFEEIRVSELVNFEKSGRELRLTRRVSARVALLDADTLGGAEVAGCVRNALSAGLDMSDCYCILLFLSCLPEAICVRRTNPWLSTC